MSTLPQLVISVLMLTVSTVPLTAEAGGLGRAVARGAARSAGKSLGRQPLGPLHTFKSPTRLERFTNRPKTDLRRGLGAESFWVRPHRGPKGTAEHVTKGLNIPHGIKRPEATVVPPGTRYHERPLRGGRGRETILHDRVLGKNLELGRRLRHGSDRP